jgi:nucleotide-binding universal stress UspA family protein
VPQELSSELKTADEKTRAEAEDYLAGMASDLKKESVEAKTVLLVASKVDEEILNYAAKNGVELIIMSTHGKSGVSRWAFGSVADRVVRNSTVPVLMASPAGCRVNQD